MDNDEEQLRELREGLEGLDASYTLGRGSRPDKYYPDGSPILSDELLPATLKWAMLFEERGPHRIVGNTKTPYGERLSTVWLGLDHNFFPSGPPLIYETMLFAPDKGLHREIVGSYGKTETVEEKEDRDRRRMYLEKHYPHDQLQIRYSTRRQAEDSHNKLKMQCLIPPRWRHFLLWTIGQDADWRFYDDADD